MAVQYLDNGNPDGTVLGQASTSLVGLWGATPVDQPAAVTSATSETDCMTALNAVIARLREAGVIAT